jgi:hypothetical protein
MLFILAALVLIWVVGLLNKRLLRHNRPTATSVNTWVEFDIRRPEAKEDSAPVFEDEAEEVAELHARARQNGHHAESQKPQL